MPHHISGKTSDFLLESWRKTAKILALTVLLGVFLFFLVWSLLSPFISQSVEPKIAGLSLVLFFIISLVVVVTIYSQYSVALCPNCGRKMFFANIRDYVRCFRCGRLLKIDFQNKKLVDTEQSS